MKYNLLIDSFLGILISGSLLLSQGCSKIQAPEPGMNVETTSLEAYIDNGETRTTSAVLSNEKHINRWCLFIVNPSDGNIVKKSFNASGSGSIVVPDVPVGTYDIYAVANYDTGGDWGSSANWTNISSLNSAMAYIDHTGYTESGGTVIVNGLEMAGVASGVSIEKNQPSTVTVQVKRLCAKIGVRKIEVDFSGNPALNGSSITINRVYASNVFRRSYYRDITSWNYGNSLYLTKMGNISSASTYGDIRKLLVDENINTSVNASNPYRVGHYFYVFPNWTTKSTDDTNRTSSTWNGHRRTRLVIEGTLNGLTRYWVVTVGQGTSGESTFKIDRNRTYVYDSIKITGWGSDNPEYSSDVEVTFSTSGPDAWDGSMDYTVNENS